VEVLAVAVGVLVQAGQVVEPETPQALLHLKAVMVQMGHQINLPVEVVEQARQVNLKMAAMELRPLFQVLL